MADQPGLQHLASLPLPIDVLPHRPPFLFLDGVTAYEAGATSRGFWHLTGDEWFFPGHFPGRPTLPGVLQAEAIAQLGAYAVLLDERYATKLPLFGGLGKAKFRRQVQPGDVLELEVTLDQLSARAGRGHGRASVDGSTACECELLFVLVDRTD
jgi:3-hydroxyacyl-[acyl-carrier-protein] dehydratase